MRHQFWVLERRIGQLIWEVQQGLFAWTSTKAHRWPYPEPPPSPVDIHPSQLCLSEKVSIHQLFMMATFFPQHEGSHMLSHLLHVQCGGKLLAWADVLTASQQQQGRWLWWQWLLCCQLYIFLRPPICKSPAVPLDLHKCSSRWWLQRVQVRSTPADLRARRGTGAAIAGCRPWIHHLSQLPAAHVTAAENTQGRSFTQQHLPPAWSFVQQRYLPDALCPLKQPSYCPLPCLPPNTAHLQWVKSGSDLVILDAGWGRSSCLYSLWIVP